MAASRSSDGAGGSPSVVQVQASSVNRLDWYVTTGRPWIARLQLGLRAPKSHLIGADFAGTVETAGKDVTDLTVGDEVYGSRAGAFAEYVVARDGVARKPANLSFEEAAAVPVAGITVLQGLRDKAKLQPGQKVLVNGASGGVGTFAVQIAKALGADRVIDYTREDFTRSAEHYDVLFDNAGTRSWRACKRVLARDATVVLAGGPKKNRLFGPIGHFVAVRLGAAVSSQIACTFLADVNAADLGLLRELIEAGKVKSVVERRYELREIAEALRYIGEGHARGKVVVSVR
jgi:NADPH:quinone reductase-like Zn-dependent oxidoreductase